MFQGVSFPSPSPSFTIGTTELGHQADRLEYEDNFGSTAVLWYELAVPDPAGSSFSVRSHIKLTSGTEDLLPDAVVDYRIDFEVNATQDYLFSFNLIDEWFGMNDGEVSFYDRTSGGDWLFFSYFDDFTSYEMTVTLEKGHAYTFSVNHPVRLDFFADPTSGRDWAFHLTAVPEPSTVVGLGLGAVVLLGSALKRRRRTER
jgi:hypothetical protein